VTCHEVRDTGAAAAIDRWFVHPVRLTGDWYSEARFDHDSHLSLDGSGGDDACTSCHDAGTSEVAADLLIPGRDNCLQCHDATRSALAVDCVACHRFHRPQGTLATVRTAGTTAAPSPSAAPAGRSW
jgi:predicted CXXCH cytochrome family protein